MFLYVLDMTFGKRACHGGYRIWYAVFIRNNRIYLSFYNEKRFIPAIYEIDPIEIIFLLKPF